MKKRNEEKQKTSRKPTKDSPSSGKRPRRTTAAGKKKTRSSRPRNDDENPTLNEFPERPMLEGMDTDNESGSDEKQSDLNKEDLESLGPLDQSMDMGDDEHQLKHRVWPVDFTGKDLDVPGSELDDGAESIGSEDEENNVNSIGGDRHEDLEEDKT